VLGSESAGALQRFRAFQYRRFMHLVGSSGPCGIHGGRKIIAQSTPTQRECLFSYEFEVDVFVPILWALCGSGCLRELKYFLDERMEMKAGAR
jgi:hypothetical protein